MTDQFTALHRLLDGHAVSPERLRTVYGFGGLHGGILSAMMLSHMRRAVDASFRPVELTTQFIAPTRDLPRVEVRVLRQGRRNAQVTATATAPDGSIVATAAAVFTARTDAPITHRLSPEPPPGVTPIESASPIVIDPQFMPLATAFEIRPATPILPYTGADDAQLCAWIRLTGPSPDPQSRLLILADALAPSYAATLNVLAPIPTVRMTVHFTPTMRRVDSEWVLLRARTRHADDDGWLSESLDLWTPDGVHLASSTQLRIVRPAAPVV
jgi:acyl-CoA thioesterase